MSEFPAEIFVDPIAARRLSCQSVYRLQHLGARKFPWQEETFTEILLGHLTGVDYRIDAACPDCEPPRRCSAWGSASRAPAGVRLLTRSDEGDRRSVRLLTRPEEGGNRARGRRGVGADFIYRVQDPSGDREVRLLIQAKRARRGELVKAGALPAAQRADLIDAATHFGATAYYLFYAESASAHVGHITRCAEHTSPSDTSIVIVAAQVLRRAFDENGKRSVPAESVFSQGRTLMCLDGCTPAAGLSAFDRALGFVREDTPDYQPVGVADRIRPGAAPATDEPSLGVPAGSALPEIPAVTVLSKRAKPPRRPPSGRVTRGGHQVHDGEILWVDLGDWVPADSDADAADPDALRDRDGYGWYPGITTERLRDSARMYWRLALTRAVAVRYLAAWAEGELRAIYQVVDDSLVIHHDHDGKVSFELTEMAPDSATYRQVAQRSNDYVGARKPGARNVVGYP
ncbi:hypothetical protein [Nocardia sp. NPDC051833]|uniref:hypothetical protein n=1 Tax=Nocardia sp. NPDC051833 TaxID=3155674 RepID=UPI0034268AD3